MEKERISCYQRSEQVDLLEDKGHALLKHAQTLLALHLATRVGSRTSRALLIKSY